MLNGGSINNVLGSLGRLAGSSGCLHTWTCTRSKGECEASDAHLGSLLSAAGKKNNPVVILPVNQVTCSFHHVTVPVRKEGRGGSVVM